MGLLTKIVFEKKRENYLTQNIVKVVEHYK